jgi:ubiquinone/menaquinone biosynthesis C-methylase UbiE
MKQVDKNFYNFEKYCDIERWSNFWYQLYEILECKPRSILEIGVGSKVISNYFKNTPETKFIGLDIAEDLEPDIVGSINKIPLDNKKFDVVCAFEVLEHLPYEEFKSCLSELMRVSNKYVLISLPHWGRHFSIHIRLPLFKKIQFALKINIWPIKHKFNGQHYWEIGKIGFPLSRIRNDIKSIGFKIVRDYVIFESPYHHFFVLLK